MTLKRALLVLLALLVSLSGLLGVMAIAQNDDPTPSETTDPCMVSRQCAPKDCEWGTGIHSDRCYPRPTP